MSLIGYARLGDAIRDLPGQLAALAEAGCRLIHVARAQISADVPPRLPHVLSRLDTGDVLVVTDGEQLPPRSAVLGRLASRSAILRVLDRLTLRVTDRRVSSLPPGVAVAV